MQTAARELPYRWLIVAAGGLLGCVAIGAMFSLPVFLQPIAKTTGWSVTGISAAMTIAFLALAFASIGWGSLSDRVGTRPVVLTGSIGLVVSLLLVSRATSLLQFQLIFGLMVGGSIAAIFAPMMACVTGWFETRRGLAVSLVSAGMGMAPMTMSPFAAWLVSSYDWRLSLQIIAVLAAALMIPAALLVRQPPVPSPVSDGGTGGQESGTAMTVAEALKSPPFIILATTNFLCCATHSGPIFHTIGYAVSCGIPLMAAVTIYSVEGLAGLGGRVAFGLLGDRFGAKRVLVSGLLIQAIVALTYLSVRQLGEFYAAAALLGFVYAGVMPLYAVLARENFPMRMMGTIVGGTTLAGSLGMATGPLTGGIIYDRLGSYAWLYLGSFGIGIGAFLIALKFRPFPIIRTGQPANLPAG